MNEDKDARKLFEANDEATETLRREILQLSQRLAAHEVYPESQRDESVRRSKAFEILRILATRARQFGVDGVWVELAEKIQVLLDSFSQQNSERRQAYQEEEDDHRNMQSEIEERLVGLNNFFARFKEEGDAAVKQAEIDQERTHKKIAGLLQTLNETIKDLVCECQDSAVGQEKIQQLLKDSKEGEVKIRLARDALTKKKDEYGSRADFAETAVKLRDDMFELCQSTSWEFTNKVTQSKEKLEEQLPQDQLIFDGTVGDLRKDFERQANQIASAMRATQKRQADLSDDLERLKFSAGERDTNQQRREMEKNGAEQKKEQERMLSMMAATKELQDQRVELDSLVREKRSFALPPSEEPFNCCVANCGMKQDIFFNAPSADERRAMSIQVPSAIPPHQTRLPLLGAWGSWCRSADGMTPEAQSTMMRQGTTCPRRTPPSVFSISSLSEAGSDV